MESRLLAACRRRFPQATGIVTLERLSAGASAETWAFELSGAGRGEAATTNLPLILRRVTVPRGPTALALAVEADVVRRAAEAGVPAPSVELVLIPADELGDGYVMRRLRGETLGPRILRDDRLADARSRLAAQCGRASALIHAVDIQGLAGLRLFDGPEQLASYREIYESFAERRPLFELAFAALRQRLPAIEQPVLVHGDFRNGNLMVDEQGLVAVLDWELAHLGDRAEDLAWICVNSWRFGRPDKAVGGFGDRDELLDAYAHQSGVEVSPERLHSWLVFGTLKWGVMCMIQSFAHLRGTQRSVEKAAIGRRVSETEVDLGRLLADL